MEGEIRRHHYRATEAARLLLRLVAGTLHDGRGLFRAVAGIFVDLYKKGLIYRGKRMVNWCPGRPDRAFRRGSDHEGAERPRSITSRYELVEEPGRFLEVATTRPETILADTAVAVNPNDARYRSSLGKQVRRPLDRANRCRSSAMTAIDPEFGTGVLKVTPAHDKARLRDRPAARSAGDRCHASERQDELSRCPELAGLDRFERARKRRSYCGARALAKEEPYENNVASASAPMCRSSRA